MFGFQSDKFPNLTVSMPPEEQRSYLVELAGNEAVELWSCGLGFPFIPESAVFAAAIQGIRQSMDIESTPRLEDGYVDGREWFHQRFRLYSQKTKDPYAAAKLAQGDQVAMFLKEWLKTKSLDWELSIEIPDTHDD